MATTDKASSFLGGVKAELTELFASAYDEISGECGEEVPEVVGSSMKSLQKKTWDLVEKKLKESYLNGKKAGGSPGKPKSGRPPADHDASQATEGNPFRK